MSPSAQSTGPGGWVGVGLTEGLMLGGGETDGLGAGGGVTDGGGAAARDGVGDEAEEVGFVSRPEESLEPAAFTAQVARANSIMKTGTATTALRRQ